MGLDDFEVIQGLGKGAFARVDKVKRKIDGKVYALKRVNISTIPPKDLEDSLNEIRILASFKHPRLIRWYETFVENAKEELCIVMELCPYGDLEQKIKRHKHRKQYIDEREIWVYAVNLLEGLAALHSKGVVHRDLKPANCLIDSQGCVKIADMNISKVSKGGNMQTQVGTPYFICPEIYLKRPYTSTSDIWSLGGVLYNLAALRPPFLADNIQNLRRVVIRGSFDPLPSVFGQSLTTLIGQLLQINPSDRPEAKEILKDPLVERHKYLLLHPLPAGQEEAEGEMLPTIRVASDKEGTKTIRLPGPAYEEEETGAGTRAGKERGARDRPPSPRSPTSVFVVSSPRAKDKANSPASHPARESTSPSNSSAGSAARTEPAPRVQSSPPADAPRRPPRSSPPPSSPPTSPSQLPMGGRLSPLKTPSPTQMFPSFPFASPKVGGSKPSSPSNGTSTAPTAAPGSPPRSGSPLSSLLPALQDMGRDMVRHLPVRPPGMKVSKEEKARLAAIAAGEYGGGAVFIDTGEYDDVGDVAGSPATSTSVGGKAKRSSIQRVFDGEGLPSFPTLEAFPVAEVKNFFANANGRRTPPPGEKPDMEEWRL